MVSGVVLTFLRLSGGVAQTFTPATAHDKHVHIYVIIHLYRGYLPWRVKCGSNHSCTCLRLWAWDTFLLACSCKRLQLKLLRTAQGVDWGNFQWSSSLDPLMSGISQTSTNKSVANISEVTGNPSQTSRQELLSRVISFKYIPVSVMYLFLFHAHLEWCLLLHTFMESDDAWKPERSLLDSLAQFHVFPRSCFATSPDRLPTYTGPRYGPSQSTFLVSQCGSYMKYADWAAINTLLIASLPTAAFPRLFLSGFLRIVSMSN